MNLDLIGFGPVIATETVLNENVQISKVLDRQTKERGWAVQMGDETEYFGTLHEALKGIPEMAENQVQGYYDDTDKEMPE